MIFHLLRFLLAFIPLLFLTREKLFLFQLVITFPIGSLWLTGATILAEKFGSKIGGVIAGMPFSIVSAFFLLVKKMA